MNRKIKYQNHLTAALLSVLFLSADIAEAGRLLDLLGPSSFVKSEHRSVSLGREEALALYSPKQQRPSFDACTDQFPSSRPLNAKDFVPAALKPLALCSDNFAVLYSQTTKTPLVVVERLSAAQLERAKGIPRTDQFFPDPRIPESGRAELSDYRAASRAPLKKQRGHLAPAADSPTHKAMAQTFALSNMIPQDAINNEQAWNKVESDVRKYVRRADGNVFVFTGPLFDSNHQTIGENKVWVPNRLFKLVYDETSHRSWAYILPNAETKVERPVDYATFVQQTGLPLLSGLPVSGSVRSSK